MNKNKVYKMAPIIASVSLLAGGIGMIVGGAVIRNNKKTELSNNFYYSPLVQDYIQEQKDNYRIKLENGEISDKEYENKIHYFDSSEYLKNATKVIFAGDKEYISLVKSIDNSNKLFSAGVGTSICGYLVFLTVSDYKYKVTDFNETIQEGNEAGDDPNKKEQSDETQEK